MPDGGPVAQGFHVEWNSKPDVPGPIGNNITVAAVTLRVQNLRAIADAGASGESAATLEWNATTTPQPVDLTDPPAGLYSKLTLDLDGDVVESSYQITGTVMVSGVSHMFDIHDRDDSKITLDCEKTLAPDGGLTLPIRIDFASALGVIDFATLHQDGGKLELDTNDEQMPAFREQLVKSFKLDDSIDDR